MLFLCTGTVIVAPMTTHGRAYPSRVALTLTALLGRSFSIRSGRWTRRAWCVDSGPSTNPQRDTCSTYSPRCSRHDGHLANLSDISPVSRTSEQAPVLAERYAHRTLRLRSVLQAVGLTLGGRPGSRHCGRLAMPTSRATLLRLVRAMPDQPVVAPRVLGVDEFAEKHARVLQARYRWLYNDLIEILIEFDPLGIHAADPHALAPEVSSTLARLRDARVADEVEQIVLEELHRWYGRRRLAALDRDRLADTTIAICTAWNDFLSDTER